MKIAEDFRRIDQSMPMVVETEQIAKRRNSRLNSRAQNSDGPGSRFLRVHGKNLRRQIKALPCLATIEWE